MEFYSKKQPDHFTLIKGIFYLIAVSVLIGLTLLFTLNIDRKATVTDGEIISQNAPIVYKAPEDAAISEVLIKEGDKVMAGDKLITLKSNKLEQDLEKKKRRLKASRQKISFHNKELKILESKIKRQRNQLSFLNSKYESEKEGNQEDLDLLDEQLNLYQEKIEISQKRIQNLQKLYEDGGISGNEFDKLYKSYLDEQNRLISYESQVEHKSHEFELLDIENATDENKLRMNLLKAEEDFLKIGNNIAEENARIVDLNAEIDGIKLSLESLTLKATVDGYITDMFTTKLKTIFIAKDQELFVLNPQIEEEFFAKVIVKEEELKDIIPGQKVHMKLSAFNHFQFGVLKGEVRHVNKEINQKKETETSNVATGNGFYALVGIPENEATKFNVKSGFKVTGDIILDRVKLYRFILESMFKN